MRALVLLIMLAGCADKSGALLYVDGKGAITFDRVEFYFGKQIGGAMPTSPKHSQPSSESALVAQRQFVDADVYSTGAPVGTLSYYVPDRPENESLGNYVAVLAFSGDQLVGIGELFDFEVTTGGAVYRYPIELVDAGTQDIERWGRPTVDCLRWTRDRGGGPKTVGVVRDNDTDCDAYVEGNAQNADCLPRVYCDGANPAACESGVLCVTPTGTNGCTVGSASCSNINGNVGDCVASICIDEIACEQCDAPGDVSSCVVNNNTIHLDVQVTVRPDYTLCAEPFNLDIQLPTGIECLNPALINVTDIMPNDKFTYTIATQPGATCRLTITPEHTGARFTTVPHMLIAIDTPTGIAPRTAFVIGLTAAAGGTCRNPGTIQPQLSFGACIR